MKKGQIFEGIIEGIEFPNKGYLYIEERKVTVKNALPGQTVRFAIQKTHAGRAEGRLLEVLSKSPLEREAGCPHEQVCGGCLYQKIPYEEQLKIKEKQVETLLKAVCPDLPFEGIKASPRTEHYRNKMEFSFGDEIKDGPLSLGMHKKGSFYDIVTVPDCRICDGDFRKAVACVLAWGRKWELPFYHKLRHSGYLRHLLVRKAAKTGELLIDLVTSSQMENFSAEESEILSDLKEQLLNISWEGTLVGFLHTKNDSLADVVQNDGTDVLWGRDYFYEELLGLTFKITPFSFFQTNSLGAEVLYGTARDYIGDTKGKVVFDLYSGTGTIAQILAPVAKQAVGVEIVEEAVEAARQNAKDNGLSNCRFLAGDVLKVLDELSETPDVIVLDPPRDGIHPKALPKILGYGVERIVYISCKPTSLQRDLESFLLAGYRVERCCAVDMFPFTGNVETIVLLSHKSPDSHINVKIEFGEGEGKVPLDAIAERAKKYQPKPKITYKMIQEYVENKYGFKVHTAYIAEVKRFLGLTMYDAPNMVEELKHPRKHPPKEKIEAITDALKYFEVI